MAVGVSWTGQPGVSKRPGEISLDDFDREVVDVHSAVCRYLTRTIYEGIIKRSPVLSGSFRRNWNFTNSDVPNFNFVYTPPQGPVDSADKLPRPLLVPSPFPVYTLANGAWYGWNIEVTGWESGKPPYKPVSLTILDVATTAHTFTVETSNGRSIYRSDGGGTSLSAVGGGLFP